MNVEYEKGRSPVKLWTEGVPVEHEARQQLRNIASLPFIYKHVAVMPDVHLGKGATVGSVIPTKGAIIPAAVGVDIGCGMVAVKTDLTANDLPDSLKGLREAIEKVVPCGFDPKSKSDSWDYIPKDVVQEWKRLEDRYDKIQALHPKIGRGNDINHLGTLGSGNHFVEVCLDTEDSVWVMLHSGSRGVGNRIGRYFINLAKEEMQRFFIHLPDKDLAYLAEGTDYFDDYWFALKWAQDFAAVNRKLMLDHTLLVMSLELGRDVKSVEKAVNCHHNYVDIEHHFGENVFVTRKGAVRAREGDLGIIPGSMGARSYIVRGKGNPESFHSCAHGAGRVMSRRKAKETFTLEDHIKATEGVECRKDLAVIDEIPMAYKDIDLVMEAQKDLVDVVAVLKQVLCVKG